MTNRHQDYALLREAAAGNRQAYETLYEALAPGLFRYALWFSGSRENAEDVLQDLFCDLLRNPGQYRGDGGLKHYLMRAARYMLLNRKRRERARDEAMQQREQADAARAADPTDGSDDRVERIQRALAGLPDEQREAVRLRLFEDLSFEAIGELTGAPENTAASRYYAALNKLKELLDA